MTDEHNTHDEFAPEPEAGDLLHLSELVKRAGQLKYEVSQTELEQKVRKTELQDILERQIPELMLQCGGFESLTLAGFKVELDRPTYAGIPSKSAIDKEKDDDVRCD